MPSSPKEVSVVLNYATEAKKTEQLLFQNIPAMLHSIDPEGTIIEVNQRWLETLGYSRSEVLGRRSIDFLTEESKAYATENVLPEFFRTGRCRDVPYQVIAKDGRILDVLLSASCERNENGQIVRSLAVMQEITARKAAERKLDSTRAYLENLLRTTKAIVVELDRTGRVRRINDAAARFAGYSPADLEGRDWFETVVPRHRYPEVWSEFERFLAYPKESEYENPLLTRSGEERFVHWHNSPIRGGGEVLGVFSIGIDVTAQHFMEMRLAENERFLREAQSVAQIGSWAIDYEKNELRWSDETFEILGLDPRACLPSKAAFLERLHPDDNAEVLRVFKSALRLRRSYEIRHRLIMGDGSIKYVCQRADISFSDSGVPVRVIGTLQDVTMAVLQELAFQESEERFRTIADFTYDWEYWQGSNKEILYISPSCLRITGYTQAEFIRDPDLLNRIVHPDDRPKYQKHLQDIAQDLNDHQLDFRILTKDGTTKWIAHGCRPVINKEGRFNGRRVSNRDITPLKEAEQLAQKLAHFDPVTGLPNRRMLLDRLTPALASAKRHRRPLALMFIDLDKFKYVNDTYGHDIGDLLLVEVGQRLKNAVRASDTAARTGGDEFIVLLPEVASASDVDGVAGKILATIAMPIACQDLVLGVSASIGISLFDFTGPSDGTELMKQADIAMYQAKQAGGDAYRVFRA